MKALPREIIPDANILFSFFKLESVRRNIFRELLKKECTFVSPKFVFEELFSDKERIKKFAHIDEEEFSYVYQLLIKEIASFPKEAYKGFPSKATKMSPHGKDVPYFALALARNIPIWSDETAFKKQSKVKIFTTKELLDVLATIKESKGS